jgi:hypothetical protein
VRKALRVVGWSVVVLLLVGAFAGYRIVWGQPFTINQLANRQAMFFLVRNPELFTMVGIADGTIVDRHSGKLAAVGIEKRDGAARTGHGLQGRPAEDSRVAGPCPHGTGPEVQSEGLPHRRARERRGTAHRA